MKLRLFILLSTISLLTGCARDTSQLPSSEAVSPSSSTTAPESVQSSESESPAESAKDNGEESVEPYYPIFEASTIEGETLTSDCFADAKLTMINVWATYCNPCINEMPDLGELVTEYDSADFQLIGIISDVYEDDDSAENLEEAKTLIEQTQANYPHLLLNESLYVNLVGGVSAVPTTFFVKQNGELIGYLEGALPKDTWKELINDLLAEKE